MLLLLVFEGFFYVSVARFYFLCMFGTSRPPVTAVRFPRIPLNAKMLPDRPWIK